MDAGTRERAVASIVTSVVDLLAVFGVFHFSDEQFEAIKNIALVVLTGIVYGIGFYYNNNYTEEACRATGEMRAEKGKGDYAITEDLYNSDEVEDESNER